MTRREFPAKVRVAAFERAKGKCEDCTAPLFPGKFQYDHDIPDALGGEPTLENCVVRCNNCHGAKTAKQDVPRISKAKRQQKAHIGGRKPKGRPMPGTRASGWKHNMNGSWERRDGY